MMFPDYSFFVCHIIYTEKVMYICDRILHTYMFNVRITYAIPDVWYLYVLLLYLVSN